MSLSPIADDIAGLQRKVTDLVERLRAISAGEEDQAGEASSSLPIIIDELRGVADDLEGTILRAESESRKYRAIFESAPDPCLVTDRGGIILEVNHAAVRLLGAPPESMLGTPFPGFIAKEDRQRIGTRLAQRAGDIADLALRVQPRGGQPVHVSITLTALQEHGQDLAWCWTMREQAPTGQESEDEAVRGRLARSEERYRLLAENSRDVVFSHTLDTPGSFEYISPSVAALTGYAPEDFYADPALAMRIAVQADGSPLNFGPKLPENYFSDTYLLRLVRKDGGLRWIEVLASPRHDSQGTLIAIQSVARDITARKSAEDALLAHQNRLQVVLDTCPAGIFETSSAGEALFANHEMSRIMRFPGDLSVPPPPHTTGAVFWKMDGTPYEESELPAMRALRLGENVQAEQVRIDLPDGRSVAAVISARPVYSIDGSISSVIGTVLDVTAMEEAEKQRTEFITLVGSELRTPLSAIKGASVMALESHGSLDVKEARELFLVVNNQVDRVTELVNNLVDMSYIDTGGLALTSEPASLREIIQETVAQFQRLHGSSDSSRIDVLFGDDLPPVMADRRRLAQVLANLLQNAARFSPPETPIVISVDPPDGGAHLTVRVQDHGMGIPQDKLHLLFQKFARMRDRGQAGLAGAGLGLAICKGIIEAHGGRIRAESPGEGQGTTIVFTLPIAAQQPVEQERQPQQLPHEDSAAERVETRSDGTEKLRRRGDQKQVLVVDDDPHLLRFLRRFLGEAGYQVTVTTDPGKTAYLVEMEEPDLVLLDIGFPGANGFDVLTRIREFSTIPVIFLTGKNGEQDVVRALKMGADDYVTKPFASSELLARVETALRKRGPGEEQTRPQYAVGELLVNFAERRVMVAGSEVSLTATEYKLLHELAANAGRVMTYDQLLRRVWGIEYAGETNLVRSFILSLRRKLQDDGKAPKLIRTERGVGYRMPKSANA